VLQVSRPKVTQNIEQVLAYSSLIQEGCDVTDSADTTKSFGDFFASALGGGAIGILFFPTGCKTPGPFEPAPVPCPDGDQLNVLGTTMGGLVGTIDSVGATVLGLIAAGICYAIASELRGRNAGG
jgi:hypothetical protein